MTDKEMRMELVENKIDDNPFDVMMHLGLELARNFLFLTIRFRNKEIPKELWFTENHFDIYIQKIREQYSKLEKLSDDTINMLRETAEYYDRDLFNTLNETLLKYGHNQLETIYTKCNPARNDRFIKIKYGEDSKIYKRILELREIISNSEELSKANDEYLYHLMDIIDRGEKAKQICYLSDKEYNEMISIIEKYNLDNDSIEYMISYKHKYLK